MRKVGVLFVALGILFFAVGPALAQQPSITILAPKAGEAITGDKVTVRLKIENFRLADFDSERDTVGQTMGHLHISLDTQPWNVVQAISPVYTFTGLKPGKQTVTVELFRTDHQPLQKKVVKTVTFDVK